MATILCSGGAGYIGTHTCISLLAAGHKVIVADDLSNSNQTALKRVERITGCEIPFYRMDIKDERALAVLFARHKIDAVIHWAGFKAVGESVQKPLAYYQNNLGCTLSLLKAVSYTHLDVYKRQGCARADDALIAHGIPARRLGLFYIQRLVQFKAHRRIFG